MEKFDIGLQASGAAIHLRLGPALLHTANVLGGCRRQKCDNKNERAAGSPDPPMRMAHVASLAWILLGVSASGCCQLPGALFEFSSVVTPFFSCVCMQSYKRSYKISCIEWRRMANGQRHPRQATEPSAFGISLSKGNGRPLFMQLHEQIVDRISAGEWPAGARLPPVRRLAEQLGINHMTVAKAYKDLAKAGFVEGRAGGGAHFRAPYGKKAARGGETAG